MNQSWRVPYVDLGAEFRANRERLIERFVDVCTNARFILRKELEELESSLAQMLQVKHCVGVGSGSDALLLALRALGLGPGDEVITVAHTFVATVAAIHWTGARPVLVDVRDDYNMDPAALAKAITPRTKAVVPVHMNGRACDMKSIVEICKPKGIAIVEDAAQGLGAKFQGVAVGAFGEIGCFSFHPMKLLHGFGDGGMVTTSDDRLAEHLRLMRNHGQRSRADVAFFGVNSRLDTLQAAMMLDQVPELPKTILRKREIAQRYHERLNGLPCLALPEPPSDGAYFDVYTSYVVVADRRDDLAQKMTAAGIEVFSHTDPPVHHHSALNLRFKLPSTERLAKGVLSLPSSPNLPNEAIDYVCEHVARWAKASV